MMSEQRDITKYSYREKIVDSKSTPDAKHIVQIIDGFEVCTCKGYYFRRTCSHIEGGKAPTFYNTTAEEGDTLEEYVIKARGQEREVLLHFMAHKDSLFTPVEVHKALNEPGLLTSIRRAITNLTKKGFLEKMDVKREGKYKRSNFTWRLKE